MDTPTTDVVTRLGRGVIVGPAEDAPAPWSEAQRVVIDDAALHAPADTLTKLHRAWSSRTPVVVELRCDPNELRAPEANAAAPHSLPTRFEFARERLYFLARANNYDGRDGRLVWGAAIEAQRLGATASATDDGDITLADGSSAWCDGGPRGSAPPGLVVVHRNTIEQGALTPDVPAELVAELADDQREAVVHHAGAARVIAPAGSGKTRVLTERLRRLIACGWNPGSLTAVAYNVRAKDTMRERLGELPPAARDRIRTLHSLGNDVVRRARGGLTLVDEWEIRRRIEALVPVRPKANTDIFAPYLEALGMVRLGLVDPHVVESRRDDVDGFGAMFDEYRDKLHADGSIDHDEQIYGALEVLLRSPDIRRAVQRECRHVLADEFQDLTPAQLLLIRLVAAPAYDVFAVGDDDQVIYGYAGADPEFLINFDSYLPGGTHHALATNYRCPEAVVGAARNVLSYNRRRIVKEIVAAKPPVDVSALTVATAAPERTPLAAIEQATKWLSDGARPSDIAVLSRVNASLLPVQLLLGEAHVPCWTPVSLAVLNRTGTRTALAYIRLAVSANAGGALSGSDIATAARRPSRSLRREILQRFERRRQWRMNQLRDVAHGLNATAAEKFELFCDDLAALARAIDDGATTAELLTKVRDDIGLGAALATLDLSGKGPDASHRDDLNALIAIATFEPDPIAFEPWLRTRLRSPDTRPSDDGVAISTVHRVKGMEWPYVIVLGAHDGLMPHALADDIEEERRIFHVAITRADTALHVVADETAPNSFIAQMREPAPADYQPAPPRRHDLPEAKPARVPIDAPPGLVNALKAWRKQRAAGDSVPAYIVLSDAHLEGIAARGPTTLDELARCSGIGPTKLERYGDEIVAVISEAS